MIRSSMHASGTTKFAGYRRSISAKRTVKALGANVQHYWFAAVVEVFLDRGRV